METEHWTCHECGAEWTRDLGETWIHRFMTTKIEEEPRRMRQSVQTKQAIYNEVAQAMQNLKATEIALREAQDTGVGPVAMGIIADANTRAKINLDQITNQEMVPKYQMAGTSNPFRG